MFVSTCQSLTFDSNCACRDSHTSCNVNESLDAIGCVCDDAQIENVSKVFTLGWHALIMKRGRLSYGFCSISVFTQRKSWNDNLCITFLLVHKLAWYTLLQFPNDNMHNGIHFLQAIHWKRHVWVLVVPPCGVISRSSRGPLACLAPEVGSKPFLVWA